MKRIFEIAAALAFAALAGACEQTPSSELPVFCLVPDDCVHLQAAECERLDCTDGQCGVVADTASNGLSCGLADPCVASTGKCENGVCAGAAAVVCPAVDCMSGVCDPERGTCVYTAGDDGASCDVDGNPCTADVCGDGVCTAGENQCPCKSAGDCPVMDDLCLGTYRCAPAGCEIEPRSAVACPDPGPCETFMCNPGTGKCELEQADDGTICARADSCNEGGVCGDGICHGTPRCFDENLCTDDLCDPVTGACSFQANIAACDDGDACTGEGACVGGACVAQAVSCDDSNDCTYDGCDPVSGCTREMALAGVVCLSSDLCVTGTVCDGDGVCGGGEPVCDDRNECTSDMCAAATGVCTHADVIGACDDGNPCTAGETCAGGVCGGGLPVSGCCNFEADCDDWDACTPTRCVEARCVADGQDPAACPATQDSCGLRWCDAFSGACGTVAAAIPIVMAAWDFEAGGVNQGFVWGQPAGRIGPSGLTAGDGEHATFQLPRRLVPDGVVMAFVEHSAGECGTTSFQVAAAAGDCIEYGGRTWAVAAFRTVDAVDAQGRLDISVTVPAGNVVSKVFVYLWRTALCDSDSILLHDALVSDLSMDASMDAAAVVFNRGSAIGAALWSAGGRVRDIPLAQDPFAVVAGRFSTSVARDGVRYVAAWGGADNNVQTSSFDGTGWGAVQAMPDIGVSDEIKAWPALAAIPGGNFALALAYGDGTDFDIALAGLNGEGALAAPDAVQAPVNEAVSGNQSAPSVVFGNSSGLVVWAHSPAEGFGQYRIEYKAIEASTNTIGSTSVLAFSSAKLEGPRCTHFDDLYYCLWQQTDGVVGGAVVSAETLAVLHSFAFGSAAEPNSRPVIVPAGDGAVAVSIQGSGATASIVLRTVSGDGAVSAPSTVVYPVLAHATHLAADRFGPAMYFAVWTDLLGDPGGLRMKVFSPACPTGFIDGGSVCTGLGDGRSGGVLP